MEEIWKDIKGYEGLYQISNLGRVKSFYKHHKITNEGKILRLSVQYVNKNYKRYIVNLSGKIFKVHRLVAQAFLPKIDGKEYVNHKDFNTFNNKVENLEWCTQKENIIWNIIHKRIKSYSYINKDKVILLYKNGVTAVEIAKRFNVNRGIITNIISKNKISRKQYKRKSKYISINKLKELINKGLTNKEISIKFNIPTGYIARRKYQIKKGEI